MKKHYQKDTFLDHGGDDWFRRNKKGLHAKENQSDFDIIIPFIKKEDKILEIGCCDGHILNYFHKKLPNLELDLYGIDPSTNSIRSGNQLFNELTLKKGTSDEIKFDDNFFDIVI